MSASGKAKAIRIEADVSQAELARDIGTTQSALSLWEAGKRRPTGDSAIKWLEVLDQLEKQS
jgi:transcriptional regulator with XRE-family HTH domain